MCVQIFMNHLMWLDPWNTELLGDIFSEFILPNTNFPAISRTIKLVSNIYIAFTMSLTLL